MTHDPLHRWRLAVLLLLAAACFAIPPGREAAAQGQLLLKVGSTYQAESPWGSALHRFAAHVEHHSQQRIQVRLFNEGALGTPATLIERVIAGSLQAYAGPLAPLYPHVPALRALETPHLFPTDRVARARLNRSKTAIGVLLAATNLHFGQWQHQGFRSSFSLGEDDAEATVTEAATRGLHQQAKRITLSRHALSPGILVYSQRWFSGLPASSQEMLARLPAESEAQLADDVARLEGELLGAMRARGIEVVEPSSTEQRKSSVEERHDASAFLKTLDEPARALRRQLAQP